MNSRPSADGRSHNPGVWALGLALLMGCATASVNWDNRIGTYSYDDALAEFGLPDRVANLEGGVKAAEWIQQRSVGIASINEPPSYTRGEPVQPYQTYGSTAPAKILRLSFTPDGKLIDWDRNY